MPHYIKKHGIKTRTTPVIKSPNKQVSSEEAWSRLKELGKQVSEQWIGGQATDAINEMRRDL